MDDLVTAALVAALVVTALVVVAVGASLFAGVMVATITGLRRAGDRGGHRRASLATALALAAAWTSAAAVLALTGRPDRWGAVVGGGAAVLALLLATLVVATLVVEVEGRPAAMVLAGAGLVVVLDLGYALAVATGVVGPVATHLAHGQGGAGVALAVALLALGLAWLACALDRRLV